MNDALFPTRRSDAGHLQITERDLYALRWIAEQYTVHTGHLAILLGQRAKAATKQQNRISPSAVRHALERWRTLRLIDDRYKFVSSAPAYVWVSRRAITELAFPFPYYRPRLVSLLHITRMNMIRLAVQEHDPGSTWLSERTLRSIGREAPIDAELHTSTGQVLAVKIVETPRM